jgi:RNA polymerase sigma-70 factor (ECF subfamily)
MPIELLTAEKRPKPRTSVQAAVSGADRDGVLVAAARGGDRQAFDRLAERHKQKIFLLAKRITRSREDAEEVVQDSFIQAFVHLDSFHGNSRFSTWLTRIAVNQALMMLRKKRQSREVSLDEPGGWGESPIFLKIPDRRATPEQDASRNELYEVVREAVAQLPPSMRDAVQLGELQELTAAEATQVLGLTVSAFKSRLYHARSRLRQALSPHFQRGRKSNAGPGWELRPLVSGD